MNPMALFLESLEGMRTTTAVLVAGLLLTPIGAAAQGPAELTAGVCGEATGDCVGELSADNAEILEGIVLPGRDEAIVQGSEEKKPPTPAHTGFRALFDGVISDFKHLPSKPNLYITVVGAGAALAVHPADKTFNQHLLSESDVVTDAWTPGHIVGQTGVMVGAGVLLYAVGRIDDLKHQDDPAHQKKWSHIGMDIIRAQILDEAIVEPMKLIARRERPDASDNHSFPSGHASVTFATATIIERHLGWKMSALGYAFASYVAASRLHDNVHWLSDVVFGAAVGTIAGRTVTEHGRNFFNFVPTPVPGGVALVAYHVGD